MRPHLFGLILAALPLPALADAVGLVYHRFGEAEHPTTSIDPADFEAQLDYLEEGDYRIWPLGRVARYLAEGRELPDRVVTITIDDGYASVYQEAFPRLRERGWPFTVFVNTEPVDQGAADYMSWDQMREMASAGAEFANHTAGHAQLPERREGEDEAAWAERVAAQITRARDRLRRELGEAVAANPALLAYPYGDYDAEVAQTVRELGYVGVAAKPGVIGDEADLRALPRFYVGSAAHYMARFRQRVAARALPVADAQPRDPATDAERPRLKVALQDPVAGWRGLSCYVRGQEEPATVAWPEAGRAFTVRARQPLGDGLSRYNCVLRGPEGRKWWYSHHWRPGQQ